MRRKQLGSAEVDAVAALLDWGEIDRALNDISAAVKGERGWLPLALFQTLLLTTWHDLSNIRLAEALDDRVSFRRLCGLAWRTAGPLWLPTLSSTTTSPGRRVGTRNQKLCDLGTKHLAVDQAVQHQGWHGAIGLQTDQERRGGPADAGQGCDEARASRCLAAGAGHVDLRTVDRLRRSTIEEDQAGGVHPALVAYPAFALAGHVGPVLLGGAQAFF